MPRPRPRRRSGSWSSSLIAARSAVPIAPIRWRWSAPAPNSTARLGSGCSARPRRSARCMCIFPAASRRRGATSPKLTRHAAPCGLYTNLITSGIGVSEKLWAQLVEAGLDHAQLSFQGADKETNDRLGHYGGSWERKRAFAAMVTKAGLPLTLNAVIHRANLHQVGAFIDLAVELGARRLEVAHTQYYGWALANRAALMPPRKEVDESIAAGGGGSRRASRASWSSTWWSPTITRAIPSLARAAGGGSRSMSALGQGAALPCRRNDSGPRILERARSSLAEIWRDNPAFRAFRGTEWMLEPCRSCERREIDWGGCRCQALALVGDAAAPIPPATSRPITPASPRPPWRRPKPTPARSAGGR